MPPSPFCQRRQLLHIGLGLGTLLSGCAPLVTPADSTGSGTAARFDLGVASGTPTPQGMVLWTRLTGADLPPQVEVQWELAEDEQFRRLAARGTEVARADTAHSVHAEPAGLAPGRWYWFRFTALGRRSATGRTRTTPAPDAVEPLRFAVASCQRWDHGHYAAWADVVTQAPDLVLFLGDYIYEYGRVPGRVRDHPAGRCRTLADYRARYALYRSDPLLQAAHAAAPWLLICDDHEVENDYAGPHGQTTPEDFARQRAAACQAWWEHQPVPRALRPAGPELRLVGQHDWGRLARLLCLDTRQHRDLQACRRVMGTGAGSVRRRDCAELQDPRRSLLGQSQEAWLADAWSTGHGWNLLAQQTLMAPASLPGDDASVWTDGWDGYAPARQRLLQTVADRQVPNCVVLGGDVHATYVADLKADFDDERAPVIATEFCGTSISSHGISQKQTDALVARLPHLRHGRSDRRGSLIGELTTRELRVQVRTVERVDDPASPVRTTAQFVVEAGRPGAQAVTSPP